MIRRDTHLDQLTDKLKEDRVKRVIAPILRGEGAEESIPSDDIQYCMDLGLVKREGSIKISNAIYSEIIPRELSFSTQVMMVQETSWYVDKDNRIVFNKLFQGFQNFFRKNSDIWIEKFDYREAGPQLLLQAFLQRVVNGEGIIEREYGLGRRRTDLHITWFPQGSNNYSVRQETIIELKILRESLEHTIAEGLDQVLDYADKCGADEAHLLIFNRDPNVKWEEKIYQKQIEHRGIIVNIWGC